MPTLICDLRADPVALAAEYEPLHAAGESLALFWPHAGLPAEPLPHFTPADDPAALHRAWENGQIAVVRRTAWLPLDEFDRCLVIADAIGEPGAAGSACAHALLAAGAEEVELLAPGDARELAQSWRSGRRTGARVLRA